MAVAIAGTRVFISAASFSSQSTRASTVVRPQTPSNAARAAVTAASTSATLPRGTRPMTCSVDDETTSSPSAEVEARHPPSM